MNAPWESLSTTTQLELLQLNTAEAKHGHVVTTIPQNQGVQEDTRRHQGTPGQDKGQVRQWRRSQVSSATVQGQVIRSEVRETVLVD